MMDDAEATLKALGMPEKSIHLERFNTPGHRKRAVTCRRKDRK
jgi:ring-1,2-phenylacetyl-CoA epoxidase subunit PaaE